MPCPAEDSISGLPLLDVLSRVSRDWWLNCNVRVDWWDPDDPAGNAGRGGKMPLRSGAGAGRVRGAGPALLSSVKDLSQEGQEKSAARQQEYEDDGHHLG